MRLKPSFPSKSLTINTMNTMNTIKTSFAPAVRFATVISKPTGHFLVAETGRTVATATVNNARHVYRVALNARLKLVNVTSQKGIEIVKAISARPVPSSR